MAELPTGTITFLFTDIEGSTTRWKHHREAMQAALARHDAILRAAIEAHGGHVFKTVGDAFYAVFTSAPDALAAALAAQHTLAAENWDGDGPLRVRMALHTGTVQQRDGDYFGPPLNRVARLLSAGHGRQVLLSHVTQELVQDHLPRGVALRDLGAHRLKELIRPEHVFQLVAPDLPVDFPPLRTLEHRPNNLPMQSTPLIGRERELDVVERRLVQPDVRLLTLSGPGGTGKTRLALQVAADLLDTFTGGVWFVNLAPISDSTLVTPTIATRLGVAEVVGQPLPDTLKWFLRDKHLLLVLDNVEHLLSAAPVVSDLLATTHHLKVLVTSRTLLGVYGEHHILVPPLQLPDLRRLPPLERLSQYEAVRLFIERAQATRADFTVTDENAPVVAEICARLDGLPLAIELAAARIRLLPPQAILQRLSSRLRLLTGGGRDLPARHQTLRGTIEWSYSLLDAAEQTLFMRLAVFAGGRTLEAVEAVCNAAGDLDVDVLDGMASLVDKSLLRQEEDLEGEPRFVMLETIHEYARERLEASEDAARLRQWHAEYFLALAERGDVELRGPNQLAWMDRLEAEHDNLGAALERALGPRGSVEQALRLCRALWWFWFMRGHLSEGRRWLDEALGPTGKQAARDHARLALDAPGAREAMALRAYALNGAGSLAFNQGDYAAAETCYEESLALRRALGATRMIAFSLGNLGHVAGRQGDNRTACARFEESLALFRHLGEPDGIAYALGSLGRVVARLGDHTAARRHYTESLALFQQLGDTRGIAWMLHDLEDEARDEGDYEAAQAHYTASLALRHELGEKIGIAECLEGLAGVAGASREGHARAARLFAAAERLQEAIGAPRRRGDRPGYERNLAAARWLCDEAAWQVAWEEGGAMTVEQAVAYALSDEC